MSKKLFSGHWVHTLVLSSSEFHNSQVMISQGPLIVSKRLSSSGSSKVPVSESTPKELGFQHTWSAPKTCVLLSSGSSKVPTSGSAPYELGCSFTRFAP